MSLALDFSLQIAHSNTDSMDKVDTLHWLRLIGLTALRLMTIPSPQGYPTEEDLQSGQLIQALPKIPVQSTAIYVVIPHRHFVPPKVQAFMRHLDDYFQHQYAWYVSPNLSKS